MVLEQTIHKVRNAGVTGAGGGGFPSHIKLKSQTELAIANGVECEPLLKTDYSYLHYNLKEVLEGLEVLMECTGSKQGYMAVNENNTELIENISILLKKYSAIELYPVGDYYPMGDEVILVREITGRIIPESAYPPDVGVVVNNVETLYNISQSLKGIPVTHKRVTVTGEVASPCVLNVPIGTSVSELVTHAGGSLIEDYALLEGGPNMGELIASDYTVNKITNAVIVLPRDHILVFQRMQDPGIQLQRSKSVCFQCRICTDICPRYLVGHELYPHKIMRSMNFGLDMDSATITSAFLCCECGLCETYACIMDLSPRYIARAIKKELRKQGVTNPNIRNAYNKNRPWRERRVPHSRLSQRLGVKPYENNINVLPEDLNPDRVSIQISNHPGRSAQPVVHPGTKINQGDMIADFEGTDMGVCYHASITGVVEEVTESMISIKR